MNNETFWLQIALTDVLQNLGVIADGIVGHSVGEIACGYADGCMSLEETVVLAYYRAKIIEEANFPPGGMAAVGKSGNAFPHYFRPNVKFLTTGNISSPDSS